MNFQIIENNRKTFFELVANKTTNINIIIWRNCKMKCFHTNTQEINRGKVINNFLHIHHKLLKSDEKITIQMFVFLERKQLFLHFTRTLLDYRWKIDGCASFKELYFFLTTGLRHRSSSGNDRVSKLNMCVAISTIFHAIISTSNLATQFCE